MYNIVSDTQKYSQFIPFCTSSDKRLLTSSTFKSTLTLKAPIEFTYESIVTLFPSKISALCLEQALFKSLKTTWTFKPLYKNLSRIQIDLDYELSFGVYSPIAKLIVPSLSSTYINAFMKRAQALHGNPTTPNQIINLEGSNLTDLERRNLMVYATLYKSQ